MAERRRRPRPSGGQPQLIAYHAPIARALTDERTSLESPADPGHRLHRRGLRRGLPPLPRDDGRASTRPCRPRRSVAGPGAPAAGQHRATSGRSPTSGCSAARSMAMIDPGAADDAEAAATVLDFWERAARGVPRRRHPPGLGHRHGRRRTTRRPSAQLLAGVAPVGDDAPARIKRFNATLVELPVPALLRHPRRPRRHRPVPARRRPGAAVRDYYRLGRERLRVVGGRRGRALPQPHGRARARRRRRHASPTSAPPTPRPRTTSTTSSASASSPPTASRRVAAPGRRSSELDEIVAAVRTGAGRALPGHRGAWIARREDPLRRLRVLHRSCGRSPTMAGVADSSTGPCRGTSPGRSTSWCRPWRATTPAWRTTARTTPRSV